jgi:hypothetical protein
VVELHGAPAAGGNLTRLPQLATATQRGNGFAYRDLAQPCRCRKLWTGGFASLMHRMQNFLLCRGHKALSFLMRLRKYNLFREKSKTKLQMIENQIAVMVLKGCYGAVAGSGSFLRLDSGLNIW